MEAQIAPGLALHQTLLHTALQILLHFPPTHALVPLVCPITFEDAVHPLTTLALMV